MTESTRLWITVLVATSFLAGLAAGILFGLGIRPPAAERGPFGDYEQRFAEHFDLSPERRRGLEYVMDAYHQQLERIKSRGIETKEPDLVQAGLQFREQLRDTVLPASQREEFDRLAALGNFSLTPNL